MLKTNKNPIQEKENRDSFIEEREKYMWEQIRIKDEEIARLKGLSKDDTKKVG